jgi:peptidoglycan/LPS O-acetylase OafA/YrhL
MNSLVVTGIITFFFGVMLLVALKLTGKIGQKQWILAGALTYPLYLLHQNIGFMIFNLAHPLINPYVLLGLTLTGILSMSYSVHIFIEKRYSYRLKNFINNRIDALNYFKII